MKKSHILAVDCILTLISSGVLSQFSPPTGEICSGDNVTFTCVVNTALGIWVVRLRGEETECLYRRSSPGQDNCGPGDRFMSNATDVNEDINSSFLRVDSITIDLNDTQVKCNDGNEVTIGSNEICIIGNSPAPQILSATISELGMCDDDGCVVTVRWREPFISCDGSVSQYVLTVTPPTCDCESLQNCKLMDNAAVYFMPGNETQYDIAVNGNISLEYDMTVRADTCDNSLTGDISPVYSINLIGVPRTTEPFSYHYVFNIITRDIMAINVSWPRVDILNGEAETAYRIVIIPGSGSGSGNEMFFDIVTADNCTDDSCSFIFSSDSIINSYSVAVEVVGCVTERMDCSNMSTLCDPEDLRVALPSNDSWSDMMITADGLGLFTFSEGNVTFDGVSYRSVATYTTTGDYYVNGEQSFQTNCQSDEWMPTARITFIDCSLSDLSPSLVEVNRVCGSVSGGGVCYSGDSVGSVAVYFCNDGYKLEGDSTRECLSSGLWNGTTPHCVQVLNSGSSCSDSTAVIVGVACSLIFLSAGVLLGVVTVYLILRARGKLSGPTSLSPPPLPPPVTYEEVGVSGEVKSTHNIQLQSSEAYGPIQRDNIHTSPNTAYGQVQL